MIRPLIYIVPLTDAEAGEASVSGSSGEAVLLSENEMGQGERTRWGSVTATSSGLSH